MLPSHQSVALPEILRHKGRRESTTCDNGNDGDEDVDEETRRKASMDNIRVSTHAFVAGPPGSRYVADVVSATHTHAHTHTHTPHSHTGGLSASTAR